MMDFFENIAPKVGVTVDMFEKLSGPDALLLYVDSLQKAGVSQQQFTFYMEAMASDSTLLLPLLRDNAKELTRLGDAAESVGAVMSGDDLAKLADAGVAIDRVKLAFTGMRNVVAVQLAPAMEKLADVFTEAMKEGGALRRVLQFLADNAGRITAYVGGAAAAFAAYSGAVVVATAVTQGFRRALVRTGIGALVVGLGEAVYQFTSLNSAVGDSAKSFDMFKTLAKAAVNYAVDAFFWFGNRAIGVVRGLILTSKQLFLSFGDIVKAGIVAGMNAMIWVINASVQSVVDGINLLNSGVNAFVSKLPGVNDPIEMMIAPKIGNVGKDALSKAGEVPGKIADAFVDGLMTDTRSAPLVFDVPKLGAQWRRIQLQIDKSTDATGGAADAAERLNAGIAALGSPETVGGVEQATDSVTQLSTEVQNAQNKVGQMRDMFASTFADIVTRSSTAKEAVSGLLDQFARMIANNAFQSLWNGTIGSGMNSSGGMNWLGNAASFLFGGGVPGFATGTPSAPGGMAWVGERGPELVNLPRGSQVLDAERSAALASGGGGHLQISLGEGLKAEWLSEAGGQSIQIVQSGIQQYDRQMPARVTQISNDPRYR